MMSFFNERVEGFSRHKIVKFLWATMIATTDQF